MRALWGLGFALVVALGFWIGFRRSDEVQGSENAGFLAESAPSAAAAKEPEKTTASAPVPAPAASAAAKPAAVPVARLEESTLAAALLHRPSKEVSVLLSQCDLSGARKKMYSAVSAALGNELEFARSAAQGLEKSDELDVRERALVSSAVNGTPVAAVSASSTNNSIAAVAMALALRARDGAKALSEGRFAEAAAAYSEVLLADATATWPSDSTALQRWTDGLAKAQDGHRWSVKGNWPSFTMKVKSGDSLTAIRQRAIKEHQGLVICTGLIERANQLRNERDLHPGEELRIPTDKVHMLVDISTRWVLYMMGDEVVAAWEGGVGKPGSETVPGSYKIGLKQKDPSWFRSGAPLVPFGNPENPLGTRWLSWQLNGVESHLGFHGTTDPGTVGGAVSSGCVRLRNGDVEVLFEILPEKADVLVQP